MIEFWFWFWVSLMVLIALAIVLIPLLRTPQETQKENLRDEINLTLYHKKLAELEDDLKSGVLSQDQYEQGRHDIERGLLDDTAKSRGIS